MLINFLYVCNKNHCWRICIAIISDGSGKLLVYVICNKSLYTSLFENFQLPNISAIICQNSILTSLITFNYFSPHLVQNGGFWVGIGDVT